MSSDVMIITKEDGNSYYDQYVPTEFMREHDFDSPEYKAEAERRKPKREACFIDEASMGDPWNEFGKWFVQRYNNHAYDLLATVAFAHNQEQVDKMSHEVGDLTFTESDYKAVEDALKTMQVHQNLDKEKVLEYLKDTIGLHIATENW